MYKLKEKPEDFLVEEITNVKPLPEGPYIYFWMTKRNMNTLNAIDLIAKTLRVNPKFVNFAGTKDKIAVTTQLISIKGKSREQVEKLELREISLKFYGYGKKFLNIGELEGNKFVIVVKDLNQKEIVSVEKFVKENKKFVNYFGEQRLSEFNAPIGKALVKGDLQEAIFMIQKANSIYKKKIVDWLNEKPSDYTNALKIIPKKLLRLYVHSYQSHIWNETVRLFLKGNLPEKNVKVPIIGFGTEFENEKLSEIIKQIMKIEKLDLRDFICRKLTFLSSEGDLRDLYMDIKYFKILEKNENSVKVTFTLGKGSYATEVIRQLFI